MSRPEATKLVEQIRAASEALRGIGCTEPLRDVLEQEINALERPTGRELPPAFTIQRTIDAQLAAWPETTPDSIVYGLVRALGNFIASRWEGEDALSHAKVAGGILERNVKRICAAAAAEEVH